ncbi:MAG TPA: VTT domain-containing protein [Streptosporangiaceae bacterium]|nr:VTT domain-containing protein [Streptosporangiaceae bacterium]
MTETIVDAVRDLMGSPWVYGALFALALIDGFFPVVPSESLVITAGVFAAGGEPNLVLVMAVAAAGAFAGDHVSFLAGRTAGGRLAGGARGRRRRAFAWARRVLGGRGGLILVVARYVPGGRTAVTVTMGAVGYPGRAFAGFDALAAVSWAIYSASVGYVGGMAFEEEPLKGLLAGLGLAVFVSGLAEVARYARGRRRGRPPVPRGERDALAGPLCR